MLVENLRPDCFEKKNFFENDYLTRLNLNEICYLATNMPGFFTK
jgi:hypothetical protein